VKAAITRTVGELEAKVAAREQERKAARQSKKTASEPADPAAEVEREHRSRMRELSDDAHGVNLDVGAALLNGLSTVDPADVNVAKFFVYSLLGSDYDDSPYTQQGERVARLAVSGIRLVIEEFRADVTKTRKDGSKGALRIDYGNGREPQEPVRWMWKYIDGAKTAGELYGRALVVIAAEQYASRLLVVPTSQRTHPTRFASHKDLAAKACGSWPHRTCRHHSSSSRRRSPAPIASTTRLCNSTPLAAQRRSAPNGQERLRNTSTSARSPAAMTRTAPSTTSFSSPTTVSNRAAAVRAGCDRTAAMAVPQRAAGRGRLAEASQKA
jgi:hypothetical protein